MKFEIQNKMRLFAYAFTYGDKLKYTALSEQEFELAVRRYLGDDYFNKVITLIDISNGHMPIEVKVGGFILTLLKDKDYDYLEYLQDIIGKKSPIHDRLKDENNSRSDRESYIFYIDNSNNAYGENDPVVTVWIDPKAKQKTRWWCNNDVWNEENESELANHGIMNINATNYNVITKEGHTIVIPGPYDVETQQCIHEIVYNGKTKIDENVTTIAEISQNATSKLTSEAKCLLDHIIFEEEELHKERMKVLNGLVDKYKNRKDKNTLSEYIIDIRKLNEKLNSRKKDIDQIVNVDTIKIILQEIVKLQKL